VQVIELLPAQTPFWHESVCVQALLSLQVVPFVLFEQVPTEPVRLQAVHWFVHAVLQHTLLAQKPLAHWPLLVQGSPRDGS